MGAANQARPRLDKLSTFPTPFANGNSVCVCVCVKDVKRHNQYKGKGGSEMRGKHKATPCY